MLTVNASVSATIPDQWKLPGGLAQMLDEPYTQAQQVSVLYGNKSSGAMRCGWRNTLALHNTDEVELIASPFGTVPEAEWFWHVLFHPSNDTTIDIAGLTCVIVIDYDTILFTRKLALANT